MNNFELPIMCELVAIVTSISGLNNFSDSNWNSSNLRIRYLALGFFSLKGQCPYFDQGVQRHPWPS